MVNLDYLYNPDEGKKRFDKSHFVDKKLSYRAIEKGMVLPCRNVGDNGEKISMGFGGIVDDNGEYVKNTYIHHGLGGKYTPPQNQFNTVQKQQFMLECFLMFGDILLLIAFVIYGF